MFVLVHIFVNVTFFYTFFFLSILLGDSLFPLLVSSGPFAFRALITGPPVSVWPQVPIAELFFIAASSFKVAEAVDLEE